MYKTRITQWYASLTNAQFLSRFGDLIHTLTRRVQKIPAGHTSNSPCIDKNKKTYQLILTSDIHEPCHLTPKANTNRPPPPGTILPDSRVNNRKKEPIYLPFKIVYAVDIFKFIFKL